MASIYVILIIAPIILFATLIFIFQSGLTEIQAQQFIASCPYPLFEGTVNVTNTFPTYFEYDIFHGHDINGNITSDDQEKVGTLFLCEIDHNELSPDTYGVSISTRQYGATLFSVIPYGQLGYASDYLSMVGTKFVAYATQLWLFVNAPAEVTGFDFFIFVQLILLALIGLGIFFVARGIGG